MNLEFLTFCKLSTVKSLKYLSTCKFFLLVSLQKFCFFTKYLYLLLLEILLVYSWKSVVQTENLLFSHEKLFFRYCC